MSKSKQDIADYQEYFDEKGKQGFLLASAIDSSIYLLALMDLTKVIDIWRSGDKWKVMVVKNTPNRVHDTAIEEFRTQSAFLEFCWQKRYVPLGIKDKKSLKNFEVPFKDEFKNPVLKKDLIQYQDKINLFTPGWLSDAIDDPNIPDKLTPALEVFLDNLFGPDQETRNWTLQWMRNFMHNFKKMMTAVVFWGDPGCGKSMFAECFGEAIGDCHSPKQNQIEDVRFNTWINHAVLILDEVSSGSKKDGKAFGDYLKSLITQPIQSIEGKGENITQEYINNCFLITSNISAWTAPIFVEEKDRRYTIVCNLNSKNLRKDGLWTQNDFDEWDNGIAKKILMKYIYNLPEDPNINVNYGVDNEFKEEIRQMSRPNIQKVVDELLDILKEEYTSDFISNGQLESIIDENKLMNKNEFPLRTIKKILHSYGFKPHHTTVAGHSCRGLKIPIAYYKNDLPDLATPSLDDLLQKESTQSTSSTVLDDDIDQFINELVNKE